MVPAFGQAAVSPSGKFVFPPSLTRLEMPHRGGKTSLDPCYPTGPKVKYVRGNPESFEAGNYRPRYEKG